MTPIGPGSQPRSRTIVRLTPAPSKNPNNFICHRRSTRGNPHKTVKMAPIRCPEPEQFPLYGPEQAPINACSPRTVCFVSISRILIIFRYILWIMIYSNNIWCYIYHSRLSQTLKFRQFIRNLFFCLCCNIFLNNVLLID